MVDGPGTRMADAISSRYAPRTGYYAGRTDEPIMLLKIIAFLAAALPLILFVRSLLVRRPTRFSEGVKAFKKQVDFAVWIFLGLVACIFAFAAGKLAWTWWTAL